MSHDKARRETGFAFRPSAALTPASAIFSVDRIRTLPVLLVITFRPEFDPPWAGQSGVTALTLSRLGQRDVGAMIEGILGNKALPADILAVIVERTDGVPLFVEEMTSAVLETGDVEAIASAIAPAAPAVPPTLHASLMARLDRLGAAKEIAQIGAAVGREFSYELIAAVASYPEHELQAALERLRQAGLVFRQGTPPHATFLFKHALVQDAAYGTLLREAWRDFHARTARAMMLKFPDTAEAQPELLAHHMPGPASSRMPPVSGARRARGPSRAPHWPKPARSWGGRLTSLPALPRRGRPAASR